MKMLDNLKWRYATKIFDPNKKVSNEDIEILKEAIRLSVSAYGLQLYKVLIIENAEIREELRKASYGQRQITEASHLFVFCNYTNNFNRHIDHYIQSIVNTQGANPDDIKQYGASMKNSISGKSSFEQKIWTEKQTYIALGNLIMACAEMKIDACPMEGFENQIYNQILGLNEQGLNASVIATVGYRSPEDETQKRKKVRKSKAELFEMT